MQLVTSRSHFFLSLEKIGCGGSGNKIALDWRACRHGEELCTFSGGSEKDGVVETHRKYVVLVVADGVPHALLLD